MTATLESVTAMIDATSMYSLRLIEVVNDDEYSAQPYGDAE
jgi:hypothetical protein